MSIPSDDPILLARELGPDALSLAVGEGETVALTGGLAEDHLRCLAGADLGARGGLWIQGEALHTLRPAARLRFSHEHCAVAPRIGRLLPELTAVENTALPLLLTGLGRLEARRRALRWLERLDVAEAADRRIPALSPGQARRVSLARALVSDPRILLVEEPLAGLETADRFNILRILRAAQGTHSLTLVIATEDDDTLAWVDRRIALAVRRPETEGADTAADTAADRHMPGASSGTREADESPDAARDTARHAADGPADRGPDSGSDNGSSPRDPGDSVDQAPDQAPNQAPDQAPAAHHGRAAGRRSPSSLVRR